MSEDDLNPNFKKDASVSASVSSLGEETDGRTKKSSDHNKYFDERARPGVYNPLEDEPLAIRTTASQVILMKQEKPPLIS